MKQQIGWYNLKEDRVFQNEFECAAWYENVLVKAGRYPVVVYDFRIHHSSNELFDNEVEGHIRSAYAEMEGTIVSDEFGARFCGMPISSYDSLQNAGKPSRHSLFNYLFMIADSIVNDKDTPWELFPEFEAREINFDDGGKQIHTYGIFKA